ncbi:SLC13 family permease [Elongatibacter sediminis]|uniref:SLC13 family permease n=1 Tax=Elongatibacter sediminis TaxID=3119006 RepID=A0AAW9R6V6_9GAMM
MNTDQIILFVILLFTMGMFLWGRWRHDMVALGALLVCVLAGLVPSAEAFSGFGHPAVITVACVLVLSQGLQSTGAVDALAQRVLPSQGGTMTSIAALIGLGALLSAFMNNVGAMALLMPIGVQLARRHDLPPGRVLMPLSFGTILGGMTTLIGTPPNLIVSAFREEAGMPSFGMFDYSPVGLAVAALGVVFIAAVGWRLVPKRIPEDAGSFDTGKYLTEARIARDSKAAGMQLIEVENALADADAQVIGMVRNDFRISAPNARRIMKPGDILVIEADPEALPKVLSGLGLELQKEPGDSEENKADKEADGDTSADAKKSSANSESDTESSPRETELRELVVMPASDLIGRSAEEIQLRARFGLNLLAISHRGRRSIRRLRTTRIQAGDLLLLQGAPGALSGFASASNCVPLAPRSLDLPDRGEALSAVGIMAVAIAGAAFGLLPAAIAFAGGVLAYMALKLLPLRKVYEAVDWPVIVLLGALIPVAGAMESTGAADLIARSLQQSIGQSEPVVTLVLILILSMTLSDFMNNAATAAVMCPIAISAAAQLGVNADTFLMAVAIGASCAFLTPIGHQNNTLILGPGGFRFGDYWKLGLPMEILVIVTGIPMLLWIWPL